MTKKKISKKQEKRNRLIAAKGYKTRKIPEITYGPSPTKRIYLGEFSDRKYYRTDPNYRCKASLEENIDHITIKAKPSDLEILRYISSHVNRFEYKGFENALFYKSCQQIADDPDCSVHTKGTVWLAMCRLNDMGLIEIERASRITDGKSLLISSNIYISREVRNLVEHLISLKYFKYRSNKKTTLRAKKVLDRLNLDWHLYDDKRQRIIDKYVCRMSLKKKDLTSVYHRYKLNYHYGNSDKNTLESSPSSSPPRRRSYDIEEVKGAITTLKGYSRAVIDGLFEAADEAIKRMPTDSTYKIINEKAFFKHILGRGIVEEAKKKKKIYNFWKNTQNSPIRLC